MLSGDCPYYCRVADLHGYKKRNDGGAEYLKGLDVKTLDQLLKELKEREQTQEEEKAKLEEEADANEYAPVTLPDEVE